MNRKKKQRRLIAIVVVAVLLVGALGFLGYQYKVNTDEIKALNEELNANTQTVYVATAPIKAGEQITNDNCAAQSIISGLESYFYIQASEIGSTAMVDIQEGEPIRYSMVTAEDFDKDTREYEVLVANLMSDQADYDTVDIRIMFPNAEDFIIASKKTVTNLNLETASFNVQLNEEEILRLASATIDAYETTGAYIYVTRYVANAQEEAIPTYLVRAETIDLINSDPNVLTKATETLNLSARLSLEARLSTLSEDELEAVANGWQITDKAGSSTTSSTATGDSYVDSNATDEDEDADKEGSSAKQTTQEIVEKEQDTLEGN